MAGVHLGSALAQIHRLFDEGTLAGLPDARLLERYASERDELAFETLVKRHGRMVMAVCRGVVDDPNDADDAFQAAFLLLARKAGALWVHDSLGGWLHRVACRIALHVKADAARRRNVERQGAERTGWWYLAAEPCADIHTVLHQEINRLPERYRKPIVLCYLEEMTYQQAATHLRWSEGTTRGRLARARELLRARLNRRGIQSAGAALPAISGSARFLPNPELLSSTVRAARHFMLGSRLASGIVPATTTALVKQAMRTMVLTKLKAAAAAVIAIGLLTWVAAGIAAVGPVGVTGREAGNSLIEGRTPSDQGAAQPARGDQANAAGNQQQSVTFQGQVLGPDGKPASGAVIYTFMARRGEIPKAVSRAKGGDDGKFQFDLNKAEFDAVIDIAPLATVMVVAAAPGTGPDWVAVRTPPEGGLSLRLVDDSVPIEGRIVDLQGKPVAGAKISRGWIKAEGPDGIDPYLELVRDDPMQASNHNFAKNYWDGFELPGQPLSVVTDANGRFRLSGIGRDRIVGIGVEGPTIQSATIEVMTRRGVKVSSPPGSFAGETIYPATFEHFIPPGRALTGVVRDRKTKMPIAGVEVGGRDNSARTKTDDHGRYTLAGFPKSKQYGLMVLAGDKPPYFVTCSAVPDNAGLEPIEVNVDCLPGIPMRLKLIDKGTRMALRNADVYYRPIYPNAHVRDVSGYSPVMGNGPYNSGVLQDDGSYLLGVLPGPGGVFVRTAPGVFRPACVDPRKFFKKASPDSKKEQRVTMYGDTDTIYTAVGQGWAGTPQSQFSGIVLVDPAEGSGPISVELALERDPKREVRVVGPDGDLLSDVVTEGSGALSSPASGVVTVSQLNPVRPQRFIFRQDAKKLIGFLIAGGDEPAPYVVKLQPWGTITGRLVDPEGKPRPRVELMTRDWQRALLDPARGVILYGQKTDKDGRFRYERLMPGQEYSAVAVGEQAMKGGFGVVIDRVVLKPGETKDLGDVQSRMDKPEMKP
jgi:RNA polymerase sigma factor (sigma-70 family)